MSAASKLRASICAAHIEALHDAGWVLRDEWVDRHQDLCQKHDSIADRIVVRAIAKNAPADTIKEIANATPANTWAENTQVYNIWSTVVPTMDIELMAHVMACGVRLGAMTEADVRIALSSSTDPVVTTQRMSVMGRTAKSSSFHRALLETVVMDPTEAARAQMWPCVNLDLLWSKDFAYMEQMIVRGHFPHPKIRAELFGRMNAQCPTWLPEVAEIIIITSSAMMGSYPSVHHAHPSTAAAITELMGVNEDLWPLLPEDSARAMQKKIKTKGLPMPALWVAARSKAQLERVVSEPSAVPIRKKM